MKNVCLATALTFAVLSFGMASLTAQENLLLGIKAGANMANQDSESSIDLNSIIGFTGGGFIVLPLNNNNLGIQTELLFSQKGSEFKIDNLGDVSTYTANLNYIEIPIMLRLALGAGPISVYGMAGPSFGFAMSSVQSSEGDSSAPDQEDFVETLDMGLVLNAGARLNAFTCDLRYIYGFSNVNDLDEISFEASNRVVSLQVGFIILD